MHKLLDASLSCVELILLLFIHKINIKIISLFSKMMTIKSKIVRQIVQKRKKKNYSRIR